MAPRALAVQPDEMLPDPRLEQRARTISQELRCMVCQNQSIDDSDAPLAKDLRVLVRERLKAGDSDPQVIDYMVARYGEFVLLKPRLSWQTVALWLTPAIVLLAGGLGLLIALRRRRAALSAAAAPPPLTPDEERKLAELAKAKTLDGAAAAHFRFARPSTRAATVEGGRPMALTKATQEGFIGTIMLDHAEKRNTLSSELINEIIAALDAFRADKLRAAVIRAQPGARVFSAGYNILELPVTHRDPLGWDDPVRHLVRAIEQFPAPVIAMVEGGVWGGACEVVLACDIIVVAPNATFAITPAKLSVPYNISGMLTFLNVAPARAVREMAFTAKPVSAVRAFDLGMVNHIVPFEEIESFTYGVARDIVENAPLAVSVMKEELRILEGAHPVDPLGFERIQGLRRIVYDSRDYVEGLSAFKEKRKPNFEGR